MEKKENNSDLTTCINFINTLILKSDLSPTTYGEKKSNGLLDFDRFSAKDDLDKIINYGVQKFLEIKKQIEPSMNNDEKEIYCEDIVIVSIDDQPPIKYHISREPLYHVEDKDGHSIHDYNSLSLYTDLGKMLIGKKVGDVIRFARETDKDEHSIKVLDNIRTTHSRKVSEYELQADIEFQKRYK